MTIFALFLAAGLMVAAASYMPHSKEPFLPDALLREVVERMGKDLADTADAYFDFPDANRLSNLGSLAAGRATKDLEPEEQTFPVDYEHLELGNPSPSIRDQEYLQHSSLWGNQYVPGGTGEGKQRIKPEAGAHNQKDVKTDAALPAYCNPPNPCPVGYGSEDGCIERFENTAMFSREFQASQDCMCDSEHMFDCPSQSGSELTDSEIDRIIEQFQVEDQHKSLVAKKFHIEKDVSNPFLRGEKLPVAAKKGNHVIY